MKQGRACPKCGSTERFVIDEAKSPNYEYANSVEPLTLTAAYTESSERGLPSGKKARLPVLIEAHVCAGCGYSELYAKALDVLERFARQELGGVRKVTEQG
jgi:predicted nucleic-acid-binding Zn-ribbon protein